ncbi:hypothetical protein [Algoriphagus terrigena]|uniref:hypothetical protein n=1 Tax=Algoriphagus terrigena TaxID=344884 RepID=UPI0004176685|nr:hypothetical protein [Algoriphagus terrigena]
MKSAFYLVVLVFAVGLVGCSEEENPRFPLMGTWESRVYVDSLDYWFVESYAFKNDSIFELTKTVRQTETGPDLGYQLISSSWYNLESDTFKYYYSDALIYFGVDSESQRVYYGSKEDLRPGIVDFFRTPEGILTFSSDQRSFEFQENCWSPAPGMECIEFESKEFIKVD